MRRRGTVAAALFAAALAGSPGAVRAESLAGSETRYDPAPGALTETPRPDAPLVGVALAHQLTLATGLAISPLAGVSAVGAWQWVTASPGERRGLPFSASPWLWIPGLVLTVLLLLKDVLPKSLKVPLDAAELLERKASAVLLAAPLLVPLAARAFGTAGPAPRPVLVGMVSLEGVGLAAASLVVFFVVFVVSQAVNALVLLSPSSLVDGVLKTAKRGVLVLLVAASVVHPLLGLAVALPIIVVSFFVFGWAWRIVVCGTVTAWDLLTFARGRLDVAAAPPAAFAFRPLGAAPRMTYGRLEVLAPGAVGFAWRTWPTWRRRTAQVEPDRVRLQRGLLFPTVVGQTAGDARTLFWLPPRYLGHEDALGAASTNSVRAPSGPGWRSTVRRFRAT